MGRICKREGYDLWPLHAFRSSCRRGETPRPRPDLTSMIDGEPRPGVTWRFLSSNNRNIGRAASESPDVESCLTTIRNLRRTLTEGVPSLVGLR